MTKSRFVSVEPDEDGHYFVILPPKITDSLEKMEARWAWKEYYRCVRTLRRIRQENPVRFKQFSFEWWHSQYQYEPNRNIYRSVKIGARRERKLP